MKPPVEYTHKHSIEHSIEHCHGMFHQTWCDTHVEVGVVLLRSIASRIDCHRQLAPTVLTAKLYTHMTVHIDNHVGTHICSHVVYMFDDAQDRLWSQEQRPFAEKLFLAPN